jgi:nitric oxide reductase subunit B
MKPPETTSQTWRWLIVIAIISFGILGLLGREIFVKAPPVPETVVSADGQRLFTRAEIQHGREVWQAQGGMQLGSIWGHGSYVAPDWSADWLHREALALRDVLAQNRGVSGYNQLSPDAKAVVDRRVIAVMRASGFDSSASRITVSNERAAAMRAVGDHYRRLFGGDQQLSALREDYAMPESRILSAADARALAGFVWWTAWASAAERPGEQISYTTNWPHEPLVGNTPPASLGLWSIASVIALIAGIALLAWAYARNPEEHVVPPAQDPFLALSPTPSMRAARKYFLLAIALFVGQVALGGLTAHYAVEGQDFYGIPVSDWVPYALARTWHTQLGIFWIATAWLGTGLYVGPMLSGHEPAYQKPGVNALFAALLIVVLGSFAGEALAIHQQIAPGSGNFWFGHMGYEFVDLGRLWAILLFAGLVIWLTLMGRALAPALRERSDSRGLVLMVFISAIAIGLFFGAGLTWGRHSSLSLIEYFRWWVVHLWVEGFFEVFATSVIALIFAGLGLVRAKAANQAVVFATTIFLTGGILGTLHHIYFAGTTLPVIAFGAMFSALEVVPLSLLGIEALHNRRMIDAAPWVQRYRWPIMFFVSVAFWNIVGAGLLGFTINPPISLYYIQGLNLTPSHGHSALFGVYGMLGIGLMLFCLRTMTPSSAWTERLLPPVFWSLNIGLAMMVFLSLVPAGIWQAWHSVNTGFWYARSPEIIHGPVMEALVWMRVPGDIIFAIGALFLAVFAIGLAHRFSTRVV